MPIHEARRWGGPVACDAHISVRPTLFLGALDGSQHDEAQDPSLTQIVPLIEGSHLRELFTT
jgi:hypothetical protein